MVGVRVWAADEICWVPFGRVDGSHVAGVLGSWRVLGFRV